MDGLSPGGQRDPPVAVLSLLVLLPRLMGVGEPLTRGVNARQLDRSDRSDRGVVDDAEAVRVEGTGGALLRAERGLGGAVDRCGSSLRAPEREGGAEHGKYFPECAIEKDALEKNTARGALRGARTRTSVCAST